MDGSYQSLEALPIEHLQIVFVASSSCSEDDSPVAPVTAPVSQQRPAPKKSLPNGVASPVPPKAQEVRAKVRKPPSRTGIPKRVAAKDRARVRKGDAAEEEEKKKEVEEEVLDAPPDGFPLRRVISIEEDHLPHLLQGGPQPLLHQLSEEDDELEDEAEEEATSDVETSVALPATPTSCPLQLSKTQAPAGRRSRFSLSSRGQPVGKETQQVGRASGFLLQCHVKIDGNKRVDLKVRVP